MFLARDLFGDLYAGARWLLGGTLHGGTRLARGGGGNVELARRQKQFFFKSQHTAGRSRRRARWRQWLHNPLQLFNKRRLSVPLVPFDRSFIHKVDGKTQQQPRQEN